MNSHDELEAQATAMRAALEEIDERLANLVPARKRTVFQITVGDVCDDIRFNVIEPALAGDAGRELLERLRRAEAALKAVHQIGRVILRMDV